MNAEIRSSLDVRLVSGNLEGHRAEYLELFTLLFPSSIVMPNAVSVSDLVSEKRPIFFLTLEDRVPEFLITSFVRSLIGRRTLSIFLRPGECFRSDRWKYTFKRVVFRVMSRLPQNTIFAILPFSIEPRLSQVATSWIDDPQMWDLAVLEVRQTEEGHKLAECVRSAAQDRQVVLALGGQNRIKGFEFFSRIWRENAEIREKYLFCSAGSVAEESRVEMAGFHKAGGLIIDRHLRRDELLSLYDAASAVWSCYAPMYNQASGIFGRAFQFGVPSIVRAGSFLERVAHELDHEFLALPFDDLDSARGLFSAWHPERRDVSECAARTSILRNRSLAAIVDGFY